MKKLLKVVIIAVSVIITVCAIILGIVSYWFNKTIQVPSSNIYSTYISLPPISELQNLEGKNVHFREGPLLIRFSTNQIVKMKDHDKYERMDINKCALEVKSKFSITDDIQSGECLYYLEEEEQTLRSQRWLISLEGNSQYILAIQDY